MKEQPFWREAKEAQDQVNESNDQLALRALTILLFKEENEFIALNDLVTRLKFHPYALAKAIAKLESLEIVSIEGDLIKIQPRASLKILKSRATLLHTTEKPAWKKFDSRDFEPTRYVLK